MNPNEPSDPGIAPPQQPAPQPAPPQSPPTPLYTSQPEPASQPQIPVPTPVAEPLPPAQSEAIEPPAAPNFFKKNLKIFGLILSEIAILCVVTILIVAHMHTKHAQTDTALTRYVDDKAGFTIMIPKSWQKVASSPGETAAFTDRRAIISNGVETHSTLSIVSNASGGISLSQFVDGTVSALSKQTASLHEISNTPETISGRPAALLVFTRKQQSVSLKSANLLVLNKRGTEFSVTGVSLASSWPQESGEIEKAVLSFRLR